MTLTIARYRERGKHDVSTFTTRFLSWSAALSAAGLDHSKHVGIPDERLFDNILNLWEHYGRQPRRRELELPPSTISPGPYWRRFRSWTIALEEFVRFIDQRDAEVGRSPDLVAFEPPSVVDSLVAAVGGGTRERVLPSTGAVLNQPRRCGPRDPSLRLRWRVLNRDRFRCQHCGASPATGGPPLHVDHIIAWSVGGDTVIENL
jgi:Homing endonuclease associated repeat/HNH endonuclease